MFLTNITFLGLVTIFMTADRNYQQQQKVYIKRALTWLYIIFFQFKCEDRRVKSRNQETLYISPDADGSTNTISIYNNSFFFGGGMAGDLVRDWGGGGWRGGSKKIFFLAFHI